MRTETTKASPKKRAPVKAKKSASSKKIKAVNQGTKKAARKTVSAKKRKVN